MLTDAKKQDIAEVVAILMKLDDTGRMLMMSNATTLLMRQGIAEEQNSTVLEEQMNKDI